MVAGVIRRQAGGSRLLCAWEGPAAVWRQRRLSTGYSVSAAGSVVGALLYAATWSTSCPDDFQCQQQQQQQQWRHASRRRTRYYWRL